MVNEIKWWNDEIVNSQQWGYGEMSKHNSIPFLPLTTPFPPVTKHNN